MKKTKGIKVAALGILLYQSVLPLAQVAYAEDKAPPVIVETEKLKSKSEGLLPGVDAIDPTIEKQKEAALQQERRSQQKLPGENQPSKRTTRSAIASGDFMIEDAVDGVEIVGLSTAGRAKVDLEIPEQINGQNVVSIGRAAFTRWLTIKSVDMTKATKLTEIKPQAFTYCSNLVAIYLPKSLEKVGSVTEEYGVFEECNKLETIDFSRCQNLTTLGRYDFYNCINLKTVDLSNCENLTKIGDHLFGQCEGLKWVDFGNATLSETTDMSYLFYNCRSLTGLNIGSFNTKKVISMRSMFYECGSLTSLDLSCFNTENVTDMGHMFYNCSSLISLDLSSFDTEKVSDMWNMFYNCSSLTSLDLNSFNTVNVESMDYLFRYCNQLVQLNLSSFNTKDIDEYSMWGMFSDCPALSQLTVGSDFSFKISTGLRDTDWYVDKDTLIGNTGASVANYHNVTDPDQQHTFHTDNWVVTFDGGLGVGQVVTATNSDNQVDKPADLIRSGYFLTDWYTEKDQGGQRVSFPYTATENTTLYADWEPVEPILKEAVTLPESVIYNGSAVEVVDQKKIPSELKEKIHWSYTNGEQVITEAPKNAGTYQVTATVEGMLKPIEFGEFTITPKEITIMDVIAKSRAKSDSDKVELVGGQLQGIIAGDTVQFELGQGTIPEANKAGELPVVTDIQLTGKEAANYALTQPTDIEVKIFDQFGVQFLAGENGELVGTPSIKVSEGEMIQGDQVPTPKAAKGHIFSKWIDESGKTLDNITEVTITKDRQFTAVFKAVPEDVKLAVLHRLYNPNSGEHFYTLDPDEKDNLVKHGWDYEGITGSQPTNKGEAVYRMYNPNEGGEHHYTPLKEEVEFLKKAGWNYEGVAFKTGGNKKVHRLYNENAVTGTHHYTQLDSELSWLKGLGWSHEGTGWYSY